MSMNQQQPSADEAAAAMARQMFGKGGPTGDMPGNPEGGLLADGVPLSAASASDADSAALAASRARKSVARPARAAVLQKAEEPEPDEDEGEDEGDEETEGGEEGEGDEEGEPLKKRARKSRVSAQSLRKALDELETVARGGTQSDPSRREVLASGLASGTLSKAERAELLDLVVADDGAQDEPMAKSFAESFATDEVLATDYDASSFLERQGQLVAAGLDVLGERIAKSADQQRAFNGTLAKSLRALGEVAAEQEALIKAQTAQLHALGERLAAVENAPMPRRGAGSAAALQKSFAGQASGGELTKSRALAGLERLMIKSRQSGKLGSTPGGHSIPHAVALVEGGGELPASLAEEILSA